MKGLGSNQSRMELKKKGSQDKKNKQTKLNLACLKVLRKNIYFQRGVLGGKLVLGIHKTK